MAKQAQAPPPVVDSHWLRLLRGPSRLIGHWLARRPTALVVAWCLLLTLPGIATGTLWRTEGAAGAGGRRDVRRATADPDALR
jgi:hypothetical protein